MLMKRPQSFWDGYFMTIAKAASEASKDPRTKLGAVIVRQDRSIASTGYNGFPRGIADLPERLEDKKTKYAYVVHGELNAILTAREPLHGYTLYTWPLATCSDCAKLVIKAGIKLVVAPVLDEERQHWSDSMRLAASMYDEAGVDFKLIQYG